MPALPLPFLVPLLLVVLLVRLLRQHNRPAALFIGICTVSSTISALRWSFHLETARLLQPVIAVLIPPTAWLCFSRLKERRPRLWPWLLGAEAPFLLSTIWLPWNLIDLIIAPLYLGAGAALIALAWNSADNLDDVRLSDVSKARATLYFSGVALLASCICDSIIAADFDLYGGAHAAGMVTAFDLAIVSSLAYAAAITGPSIVSDVSNERAPTLPGLGAAIRTTPEADDRQVFEIFERLVRDKMLFKDPDLTLNRLARRAAMPTRTLSAAVNRVVGRNVSQVVNEYRIAEARKLLLETSLPVTTVMENVGFRTKSNFNREFLRVTGTSPRAFRQKSAIHSPGHTGVPTT